MNELTLQEKIINVIVLLQAAMRNLRMYPPTSEILSKSTQKALDGFHAAFLETDCIDLAESEKSLLVQNRPLSEKDLKKPQVAALLDMMLDIGIRSISFEKGLQETELQALLEIISKKPEDVEKQGGITILIKKDALPHIRLDHKIFVAMDKGKKVISSNGPEDKGFMGGGVEKETGTDPASATSAEDFKAISKDPKMILKAFRAGLQKIQSRKEDVSDKKRVEKISQMLETIANISTGLNQNSMAQQLAGELKGLQPGLLNSIIRQGTGGGLFGKIAAQLGSGTGGSGGNGPDGDGSGGARSGGTVGKAGGVSGGSLMVQPGAPRKGPMATAVMDTVIDKMIRYLGNRLSGNPPNAAKEISGILTKIDQRMTDQGTVDANFMDSRVKVSHKMVDWAQKEKELTADFEQISIQLKELAQSLMINKQFGESSHILKMFNQISRGKTAHSREIQDFSRMIVKDIGSNDQVFNLLTKDLLCEDKIRQQGAFKKFSHFDMIFLEKLLDLLRDSEVMSERLRILRVIAEIKPPPEVLIERLKKGGHWYYHRNLILLLGKVGDESHVNDLKPFLDHEEENIQRETINSIYNIGGRKRGDALLSKLPSASPAIKIKFMSMLGALKHEPAVPRLADIIHTKLKIPPEQKEKLDIAACETLGLIGSVEAIPGCQAIVEQKGFF